VKEFTEEMQELEEFSISETLRELRRLCYEDKGFFFETLENEAGQVLGLVFASSTMVADARRYGDLVNMDFSFAFNRFGFHFGMASGVGCEYETVPLVAALVFSLALPQITWVVKQIIHIIGHEPEVVFVDGCVEEHLAIQAVCPRTILCLCTFHLFMQNLKDHMQKLLAHSWSRFYVCMWRAYYAETEGFRALDITIKTCRPFMCTFSNSTAHSTCRR